ncbi:hypothetical protein D4R42_01445 [bacterium]|nr:MAG: hypothetical protein D4R42_01445 [bacterium]
MPKQQGAMKANRPLSIGELANDLARNIQKKDPRYDFFYNYPFPPVAVAPGNFFTDGRKTKALFGGNRSRKTTYGLIEAVMVFTGIIPKELKGVYAHEKELLDISPGGAHHRPRHVRIIVMDYGKHWNTVIRPMLLGNPEKNEIGLLPEGWSKWDKENHIFEGPDGSFLDLFSSDPAQVNIDTRNLRGASMDHTMIDEINTESTYGESLVRGTQLNDGPRTVTQVYCPQEGYDCWHYETFYKACYDAITKKRLPIGKQNKAIFSQQISMKDNPSISAEQIEMIVQSLRQWEVAYRVFGEYSYRGENPYFQIETLIKWEDQATVGRCCVVEEEGVDVERGKFGGVMKFIPGGQAAENGKYDETKFPVWRVWKEPEEGHRYLLSADVAAGNERSDYQSAKLFDATTKGEFDEVASLRIKMLKPGDFGQQCACMATIYGKCLLVPESNNTGEAFIDRARNYANLYTRISGTEKQDNKETTKYGFSTDVKTKGPMLETLYKHIENCGKVGEPFLRDRHTIMELQGYEERIKRNKENVPIREWGARAGSHDDTVMATAIGCRVILTEYYKLSACKLSTDKPVSLVDEHKFDKKKSQRTGAFSKLKPQKNFFKTQANFNRTHRNASR